MVKEKENSASTIDVYTPPDTKTIIEEILDLILDDSFNKSASNKLEIT